jgi:phage gp37-like protein/DNA invertase Pin-like site-specific DNA recombinase
VTEDKLPLRVAIWAAVSSKHQAEPDKESLAELERLGREFATSIGGEVVRVYRVPGHTRDIVLWSEAEAEMDAYRDLRRDIAADTFDVLYGIDVDRLGRDPALGQQVISLVEKAGGEAYLESAPHQVGHKTTGHRYLEAIMSVRAGEEQQRRKYHYRTGMKGHIRKGLLPTRPPFWLDSVRDDTSGAVVAYQFNDQAAALDMMTRMFLASHSHREIRKALQDSPYPPPRSGQRWWPYTVYLTLASDAPAGYVEWAGHRSETPSDKVPARWDAATHAAIVRERRRRAKDSPTPGRGRRDSRSLAGVLKCRRCGSPLTRQRSRRGSKVYDKYRCGRHAVKSVYPEDPSYAYHPNAAYTEAALAQVAEFFQSLTSPARLDVLVGDLLSDAQADALRTELADKEAEQASIAEHRRRLGHGFAAGDVAPDIYRQVDDELQARQLAAQARAGELRRTLDALPGQAERRQVLADVAVLFPTLLAEADEREIAIALQNLGLVVEVEEGQILDIHLE